MEYHLAMKNIIPSVTVTRVDPENIIKRETEKDINAFNSLSHEEKL